MDLLTFTEENFIFCSELSNQLATLLPAKILGTYDLTSLAKDSPASNL